MPERKTFIWLIASLALACVLSAHAERLKPIASEEHGILLSPGMAQLMEEAEAGDADAANTVGVQYEMGLSVVENYNEAMKWYRKAAEMGSVEALYNIGAMHEGGAGVPRNKDEALRWYEQAAAKGHGGAQTRVKILKEPASGAK
ncbi:MAG: tetratricopeptide repeat protein [Gammaproteobacteria bacterium]